MFIFLSLNDKPNVKTPSIATVKRAVRVVLAYQ